MVLDRAYLNIGIHSCDLIQAEEYAKAWSERSKVSRRTLMSAKHRYADRPNVAIPGMEFRDAEVALDIAAIPLKEIHRPRQPLGLAPYGSDQVKFVRPSSQIFDLILVAAGKVRQVIDALINEWERTGIKKDIDR